MDSSKELHRPEKTKNNTFPNKLYNHIIDIYEKNSLSVIKVSLPLLIDLTKNTRNVLQCIYYKLPKRKIPRMFIHNIKSYDNRDRITQQFVIQSANALLNSMNKCHHSFLSNSIWNKYHASLESLYDICLCCTEDMKQHSKYIRNQHDSSKNELNKKRLQKYRTVEAQKMTKMKVIYNGLYEKLKVLDFYEYTIITTQDIDTNYSKEKLEKESLECSRKRRQRFRDEMIFPNISYSFYLWQMGASSSTAMIVWKIPFHEKDRNEEKLIQCISQSCQELPTFGNRKD